MAKWKWHENKTTVGSGYPVRVISCGWMCADCGVDINRYLGAAGYSNSENITEMKRHTPRLDFCPACGTKKTEE